MTAAQRDRSSARQSGTGRLAAPAANMAAGVRRLLRPPSREGRRPLWPSPPRLWLGTILAILAVGIAMLSLDGYSIARVRDFPEPVVVVFRWITDLGLSGWFLYPLGLMLLALAVLDRPQESWMARGTLAALATRVGFLFTAVAIPGVTVAIVKRLIGRARPFVDGDSTWNFGVLVWDPAYASMPSGHATTGFAVAVAIGAMWPAARPLMWTYAALVALSRVVVTAHHPSDIIAGAIFGTIGAFLVLHWFAVRRLGFAVDAHGRIRRLPGPSWRRIKTVARRRFTA